MKLGLTLPYTDHIPREMVVAFAQSADRLGYHRLWVAEAYGWEAFTTLTQLACATERIGLATGIVNVFSRTPGLIAQSTATLDAISGGRFALGLGTSGHQVISGWHGMPFEKGLQRMRETMDIVRRMLRRERMVHSGEVFHLDMGLKLITHPVRDAVPMYVASLTPAGVRLAGEMADGWMPVFLSPRHFDEALRPWLVEGAERSGRPVTDCAVCPMQAVVVTADRAAGRNSVRPHLALYVGGMGSREKNYYNQLFRRYGFEDEAKRVQDLYLERRRDEAIAAVTDEMVDLVTIIGEVDECRDRLAELESLGINEVAMALSVPGNDPSETLAALEALAP